MIALVAVHSASAHANPIKTSPANGDVLVAVPTAVTMWFSETPDPAQTQIQVFDTNFSAVDNRDTHPLTGGAVTVDLPATLPNGTYTVRWSAVSAVDGHHTQGAFVFAVGGPVSVQSAAGDSHNMANMAALGGDGMTADPVVSIVTWLFILVICTISGALVIALFGVRPEAMDSFPDGPLRALILGASVFGILVLIAQAFIQPLEIYDWETVMRDRLWLTGLFDGHFALLWWAKFVLLLGAVSWATLWTPAQIQRRAFWLAGLAIALLLPITRSLESHGAAAALWTPLSIAIDWAHLLLAGVWIGGLLLLTVTLPNLIPAQRRAVLTRFSAIATLAIAGLTLTGVYSSTLELYQVSDLWETVYGRWLLIKLAIIGVMLLLGLRNNLALRPAKSAGVKSGEAQTAAVQRRVMTESILGSIVLLTVGILVSSPTPTPPIVTLDRSLTQYNTQGDLTAALRIAPNIPGRNTYTLKVTQANKPLSALAGARIQFVLPEHDVRTPWVNLTADANGVYMGSSIDLSAIGSWQAVLDVVPDAQSNAVRFVIPWTINSGQTGIDPTQPRTGNLIAVALLSTGIVILLWPLVLGQLQKRFKQRTQFVVIGLLVILAVPVLISMSIGSLGMTMSSSGNKLVNPNPPDTTSIVKGQAIFQQICAGCHGAQGLGDGANASLMAVQPANLQNHVGLHSDADLYTMVMNGYGAMPASIGGSLTADQRWNVINYLRTLVPDTASP